MALKLLVQRALAGIHEQAAARERGQLVLGRDDDDVVSADGADDVRADLLVAASEDVALAADDADDDPRRPPADELRDLRAREIEPEHPSVQDRIDAEQGAGESEVTENALRRRARAEDIDHARPHLRSDLAADAIERRLLGHAAGLCALHELSLEGHAAVAVELRRDAARPHRLLIDIHDLGFARPDLAVAIPGDEGGELAGRLRTDGKDGRMHLHTAG